MRNVVEEQPEYDIIYGNKISRFSGKPLDPNVERRLTCKIHNYPDDRCGKKGKYWKAKDGWS